MSSGGGSSPAAGSQFGGTALGALLPLLMNGGGAGGGMPSGGTVTPIPNSAPGGMIGNPSILPQGATPRYTASPAAQAQINSLLAGTAGPGTSPGGGMGSLSPGAMAAFAYDPQSEGGGSGHLFDLLGPEGGNFTEGIFGANNRSALGDIWGAIMQGVPISAISDESWAKAGYGPGGAKLEGKK